MKNRSLESHTETSAGMEGVRVRKPEAEIMKSRIRGCHKAFFLAPDKLKQLPMVENITLNSHQSRETTVLGLVLQR